MATEHDDDQNDDLQGLRRAAKDGKAALSENAELKRELLFARAGIDTSTKLGKMLFKTYEGDSIDELRTEATEIGLFKPAPEVDDARAEQDQQQQDFRKTVVGGTPAGAGSTDSPDPTATALASFHAEMRNGSRREDAGLAAIDRVLVAAANGDKRAIFDPTAWANKARIESASRG